MSKSPQLSTSRKVNDVRVLARNIDHSRAKLARLHKELKDSGDCPSDVLTALGELITDLDMLDSDHCSLGFFL